MSPGYELFRRAMAASLSLNGGGAPRRWRQQLRRRGARLDAERRATRWVLGMADVLPALRDGPLWGDYLSQLVAGQASPRETRDAARSVATEVTPRASHRVAPVRRGAFGGERHARAAPVARRPDERPARFEDADARHAGNAERASMPSRRTTRMTRDADPTRTTGVRACAATIDSPAMETPTLPERNENSSEQGHGAATVERRNAASESQTTGDVESRRGTGVVNRLPLRASQSLLSRLLAQGDSSRVEQPRIQAEGEAARTPSASAQWATTTVKRMPHSIESSGVSGEPVGSLVGLNDKDASVGERSSLSSAFDDRIARRAMAITPGTAGTSVETISSNHEISRRLRRITRLAHGQRLKASLPVLDSNEGETIALVGELVNRAGHAMWRGRALPSSAARVLNAGTPLAEQWSLTLKGETVPLDLLSSLAFASLAGAASGGKPEREKTSVVTAGHDDPAAAVSMHGQHILDDTGRASARPSETLAAQAQDTGAAGRSQRVAGGNGRGMSGVRAADEMPASEELRQRHEHTGSFRPEGVNALMPAFLHDDARGLHAPELSPLIPPHTVDGPVLPVAVAAARQGARVEAKAASELAEPSPTDLDALAEKIKLILDEQARRHGIDV